MRPRRARLGWTFTNTDAIAPHHIASMRPRRARLGWSAALTALSFCVVGASMRPRRARLGWAWRAPVHEPVCWCFNEAEARTPRMAKKIYALFQAGECVLQ